MITRILLLCFLTILGYSSFAQTCTGGGDQVTYGINSWIGYVYDHNGAGNPITTPFATYKGYVTETANFDRNWGVGNPSCAASGNNFSLRYRMNYTFSPGTYSLTVGGDDGVRLSIDGGATWILGAWNDHGYTTYTSTLPMGGSYDMVIEFYEKTGDARASFSIASVSTEIRLTNSNSRITACGGTFYDSGGSGGEYASNQDYTVTFYPATAGDKVRLDFSSFVSESSTSCSDWDILRIYDGNNTTSNLVYESQTGCGSRTVPGIVTSTNCDGTLTVRWKSDGSVTAGGWIATLSCVSPILAGSLTPTHVTNCTTPNGAITVNPVISNYHGGTYWYKNDFSSGTPQIGSSAATGGATLDAGNMRLTNNVNSQSGILTVANPGFNTGHVEAEFNMFIGAGGGADGLFVNYGDLSIFFDTYRNGAEGCLPQNTTGGATAISASFLGAQVSCGGTFTIRNTWQRIYMRINTANQIYLKVGNTVVFNNVNLPAGYASANKSAWTWVFNGITGGANDQHRIDNLNIVAYNEYEYSINNTTWQNNSTFSGLNTGTYSLYMRSKAPTVKCPSQTLTLGPITIQNNDPGTPGNPNVWGDQTWNVYGYNNTNGGYTGNEVNLSNVTYHGWTVQGQTNATDLGFNTTSLWNQNQSPAVAPSWSGCNLAYDYFTYRYKRKGFPCGTYQLRLNNWDDGMKILVNGVEIWSCGGYYDGTNGATTCVLPVTPGAALNANVTSTLFNIGDVMYLQLDANSEVEVRVAEATAPTYADIQLIPVTSTLSNNNDVRTCYVAASSGWNTFTVGDGRLMVSIEPGASTLGNVEVTSYVAGSPFLVNACAPLYNPAHETAVLGRRWRITPTTQPTNSVRVRLYFDQNEHTALVPLSGTSSNPNDATSVYSDLRLSKYHHPTNVAVNGVWTDNCANIPSGQMSIWNPVGAAPINTLFTGFDANGRYTEYLITPPAFSEFWLHGSTITSPLAVTLTDFSASCEGNETSISWSTASEQNSDYFILERSRDGYVWNEVATVAGAGTTNTNSHYSVADTKAGEVYYRLRQFDFDGVNETFGPIIVDCSNENNELIVYPNPNGGNFTVALNTTEAMGESTIFVQDLNGKVVSQRDINVLSGTNTVHFEGDNLVKGTYIVSVKGKDNKTFIPVRLIIQ